MTQRPQRPQTEAETAVESTVEFAPPLEDEEEEENGDNKLRSMFCLDTFFDSLSIVFVVVAFTILGFFAGRYSTRCV